MVQRCPKDGQTLGWHLFANDTDGEGNLKTNGQLINCKFGESEEDNNGSEANRLRVRTDNR